RLLPTNPQRCMRCLTHLFGLRAHHPQLPGPPHQLQEQSALEPWHRHQNYLLLPSLTVAETAIAPAHATALLTVNLATKLWLVALHPLPRAAAPILNALFAPPEDATPPPVTVHEPVAFVGDS